LHKKTILTSVKISDVIEHNIEYYKYLCWAYIPFCFVC